MSTDKGYIKLYRDVRDHWLWKDKPFAKGQAWTDLLMMVNHDSKKTMFDGRVVTVNRGSCITSIRKLADRWGWSRSKVARFLDELERDQMLIQNRATKRTALSIVNYSVYQGSRATKRATEKPLTSHRRATDEHKQYTIEDTIEERKEEEAPSGDPTDTRPWWEQEDDETDLPVQP